LQHLLFCDATKIALPLNRFRIGLGMTALGAMKVATCPKTGAPSHHKYAAVSGALGSACRGANQTEREGGSSDFTDPCWHAPYDLVRKRARATKRNTPGCSGADEKRRPPL
jgi:hypothetical protein